MSKNAPFKSKIPYLRRAHEWFTSKHNVAYPWQATKRNPELLIEWCEVLARFRTLEDKDERQQARTGDQRPYT